MTYGGLIYGLSITRLFAAITRKTGKNFRGRPTEPEKSFSRFPPVVTKAILNIS